MQDAVDDGIDVADIDLTIAIDVSCRLIGSLDNQLYDPIDIADVDLAIAVGVGRQIVDALYRGKFIPYWSLAVTVNDI